MTFVIAVSNEKGGVAKTTTSLALGSSLAKTGQRVLLIDLDSQADLTLGVGLSPNSASYASIDLLVPGIAKTFFIESFCLPTGFNNLNIIPSNGDMFMLERKISSIQPSSKTLRQALKPSIPLPYDYIIIDCPPALDPRTVNALTACDLLIIPTQAEYFSANSIRKMLDLIRYIRKEANPLLAYRILITMLDLRNGIHVRVSDLFQKKFEACLFKTQIEIDTHLRDSQTAGVPITNYMPSSRGSLQYSNLAQEISEYVEKRSRNQA